MSLDAEESSLTRYGRIVIEGGEVIVEGFEGKNCSCRDIAVLASAYGIEVLAKEMHDCIRKPGGGKIAIG